MKVLVCGGRNYRDYLRLDDELGALHLAEEIDLIIQGGAKGADFLATVFAEQESIEWVECPAQWDTHGRAAGHIRNQKMLDDYHPDLVVAFPGGPGTANMIAKAKKAGVRVIEVQDV